MQTLISRLSIRSNTSPDFWRVPGRIAYVVNHCYPYSSNGYAVRTHGVAAALAQHGLSVVAINRPGMPWDLPGFDKNGFLLHHDIDGVRYLHLREPASRGLDQSEYLSAATEAIKNTLRLFKPSVLMAASNWENALPAAVAARELGLPFYYEVRGFWEVSRASREPAWESSSEYKHHVEMETAVATMAERVFTLNRFMREELIRRGVDRSKIDLVPNAYGRLPDLTQLPKLSKANLGITSRYVVGYVGSFSEYEGLDDLVRACARLRRESLDLSLLLVGSSGPLGIPQTTDECATSAGLMRLARELGFGEHLHLTGRITADELPGYYSLIDLVVIPRKPLPVCELVSPIKPLEAAAFGKPLLVSDVKPLKEMIEASCAGEWFKAGDINALSNEIRHLLLDNRRRILLSQAAKQWIMEKRSWDKVTATIINGQDVALKAHREKLAKAATAQAKLLRVACIMDEFTYHSYAPECVLRQLTPDNAVSELEDFKPELLFIESAWRGKDELWNRKIGTLSQELKSAVAWCKARRIPTVFWNKEDPIHFETFLTTAQQFDYVFTTDIDCINRYKAALGHERVYLLPFACQPSIHNPIELYERKDAFCFAGAYYVRYPERTRDLENYIEELPKFRPLEIYDRNFGKDDVNYMFPPQYQPYIVGNLPFNEIDRAYKGYRYAINLNSIKQSQTMFARRVYELLGSNTITVSNFSRGVRLMFGDLVITTDSGVEIVRRLREFAENDEESGKLRLAALRKIMQEHTYSHRLAYVAAKALKRPFVDNLPPMVVAARAGSQAEYETLISHFERQRYAKRRMVIVVDGEFASATSSDARITAVCSSEVATHTFKQLAHRDEWLAPMVAPDYYGPNYLLDIALATRYTSAKLIGKGACFSLGVDGITLENAVLAYRPVYVLEARSSAIKGTEIAGKPVLDFLVGLSAAQFGGNGLAIDPYNYCRDLGIGYDIEKVAERVDDLSLDTGIPLAELLLNAESIPPLPQDAGEIPRLAARELAQHFGEIRSKYVVYEVRQVGWRVTSQLPYGKHEYHYAPREFAATQISSDNEIKSYLDVTPGLNVQYVLVFLDDKKGKIGHVILTANCNHTSTVPAHTKFIRLGFRIHGGGQAEIKQFLWEHRKLEPAHLFAKGRYLLLTNHYPSYDELYRNAFVHSRVKAYRERGAEVDVFRLRVNEAVRFHEFEDIDVISGCQRVLDNLLASGKYKTLLVHFLNENMWTVLQKYIGEINIFIWVHGAEIQSWHRRNYNYENECQREKAKLESTAKLAFWRTILTRIPENMKLIFVSQYLADTVMEDLDIRLQRTAYTIIHNPTDTVKFKYNKKPIEQRKKILSIRPYASRTYANDLSVKAIMILAKRHYFNELEFRMIGDGPLFNEILAPLREFRNVHIEQRFLTHAEIVMLHNEYGIFLCPSRMDTQGVSRDEAMSSGLVPVTNEIAAIPEFVDNTCAELARQEDADGLAAGISLLFDNPDRFIAKSRAAAQRVRSQSSLQAVIKKEMKLFCHDYPRQLLD